jgi:hypothetical protein
MIDITKHEFHMLKEGYHPDYITDDELGENVDDSKDYDTTYRKEVKRRLDGQMFYFEYIHNTADGGAWSHEEPCSGDFQVDLNKKDILDPYNELNLNEVIKEEPKKIKTLHDFYFDVKNKCSDFDLNNPIIPVEDLKSLLKEHNAMKTNGDLFTWFNSLLKIATKYEIEVEGLKHQFTGNKIKTKAHVLKYQDNYNEKFNILSKIKIQGQVFELTAKEIKKLRNSLN